MVCDDLSIAKDICYNRKQEIKGIQKKKKDISIYLFFIKIYIYLIIKYYIYI